MGPRDNLEPDLREWLDRQKVFFVATAPLAENGHVNCSPKGGDTFRVIGDKEVAYLDLTGSGIETISHIQENGRIVIMFCAFEGGPKIVRLHGTGEVVYPGHPDYPGLIGRFPHYSGARAVIRIKVQRICESCGFGVPLLDFVSSRDALDLWAEKKGPEGLAKYRDDKNRASIDGVTGYKRL